MLRSLNGFLADIASGSFPKIDNLLLFFQGEILAHINGEKEFGFPSPPGVKRIDSAVEGERFAGLKRLPDDPIG